MSRQEPLDQLQSFYSALDAIPTPTLMAKPPSRWGTWMFALAPIGAVMIACGFISFCASGSTQPSSHPPVQQTFDHYAIDEIQSNTPRKQSREHVSTDRKGAALI